MAERERLIADIMAGQQRMQHQFAHDRSNPLFNSPLTMAQLRFLLVLSRLGSTSGRELAGLMGVSLATLTGMVDRLVAQDMVARHADPRDRRVRRLTLTTTGAALIADIITTGAERQRRLLERLDEAELRVVAQAVALLVRAAAVDAPDPRGCRAPGSDQPGSDQPGSDQPGSGQPGSGQVEGAGGGQDVVVDGDR